MADPAPSSTKYRSLRSRYPGLSTKFLIAIPCDSGGVEHSEKGVTEPEEWKGGLFCTVTSNDGSYAESVSGNLDEGTENNHHPSAELRGSGRGLGESNEGCNVGSELHGGDEYGRLDKANGRVDDLKERRALNDREGG